MNPTASTLAGNTSTTVTVTYATGPEGTGTLGLLATGTMATDGGSVVIPVAPPPFVSFSVSGGTLTFDARYLLQETADAYDSFGRITQLTDARGKVTQYTYHSIHLTGVTRVIDGTGPANLVTTISYDAGGNVSSITDEGGGTRSFQYDGFGRLTRVLNSSGSVVKAYGYLYSRTSGNGWTFDATSPNAVVDSTFMQVSPTLRAIVTTGYLDGLGRPIQTVTQNGAESIVTAKEYDTQGRPWRTWKPYSRTGSGYDPGFVANATAYYNQLLGVADAKPYSDSLYTADALSRVTAVIPEAWRPTTRCIVSAYDVKPSSLGYPWSLFSAQLAGVTLSNVTGRLAGTASTSNGAWQLRTRHTP